jgi:hypothetical protein
LAGRKPDAIKAYNQSLSWNPSFEPALDALRKLGQRRQPVLPSLPRSHPINVFLGKTLRPGKKTRQVQLAR